MANEVFPETFTRILLVEGEDDFRFFEELLAELGLEDSVHIYQYKGRDNLSKGLSNVVKDDPFKELEHLGIVRDADFNTDAMSSIRSHIDRFNRETGNKLAKPVRPLEPAGESPRVSAFILPNYGVDGMLEDLVLNAYGEDPVHRCVSDYFSCLEEQGISPVKTVLPKARIRVFIAGKVVDDEGIGKDRRTWEMSHVYSRNWWSWDSPVFDDVKAYLRQLAS